MAPTLNGDRSAPDYDPQRDPCNPERAGLPWAGRSNASPGFLAWLIPMYAVVLGLNWLEKVSFFLSSSVVLASTLQACGPVEFVQE